MQRKYSEPNAYIDNLPKGRMQQEELYDDVDLPDLPAVRCPAPQAVAPLQRALQRPWANIWPEGDSGSEGEGCQTAAKGIPSPWGNPGFCNGAEAGVGEELVRNRREGFQQDALGILRKLG